VQIAKMQIDRFGAWTDLALGPLSSGVNVYWGQETAHRTALIDFTRSMLYGFDPAVHDAYLKPGSRDAGGSLALNAPAGLLIMHRHDSGSPSGRLIVEGENGPLLNGHRLESLTAGVPQSVFDRVFVADFHRPRDTGALIDAALAQGLAIIGGHGDAARLNPLHQRLNQQRRWLDELAGGDVSLASLLEQRRRLRMDIEALEATVQQHAERDGQLRRQLQAELVDLQQQLDELHAELRSLDAEQEARGEERQRRAAEIEQMRFERQQTVIERRQRLAEADAQLARWRQVLSDIETRRERLQAEHESEGGLDDGPADPRQALRQLEDRIGQLDNAALQTEPGGEPQSCSCQQLRPQMVSALQALREDIYHLCNHMNLWEAAARRSENGSELAQMRRCESELRQAIRSLSLQRRRWADELDSLAPRGVALHGHHADLCRCAGHPTGSDSNPMPEHPQDELDQELLSVLDAEIQRLDQRRRGVLADIDQVELELGDLRERLEPKSTGDGPDPLQQRLEAGRIELQRVERLICDGEKRRDLQADLAKMENEVRVLEAAAEPGEALRHAGALLRQMSLGQWHHVAVTPERNVWVRDRNGTRFALADLKPAQQDQVHLSLCLAIAAALGRRGTHLPVILHDPLLRHDGPRAEAIATALYEFAAGGHQILLFLGSGAAAQPFRARQVPVRQLPNPREIPLPAVAPLAETISEQKRRELNHQLHAIAEEAAWTETVANCPAPNAEEFSGELTDRVQGRRCADLEPVRNGNGAEYFLRENSLIDEAPSIDAATAERFRKIGVLYVRDLLHIDIDDAALRLRHAGITAAMIGKWRAEALLVCRVPRLRPYDARILVACGIECPKQLARLDTEELRRRVEAFSATSTGRVLLRSGTRDEWSRLTRWIQSSRRSAPQRHSEPVQWYASSGPSPRPRRRTKGEPAVPQPMTAGKVPQDDAVVLKLDRTTGSPRFYLSTSDPVEQAPAIGPKTAARLEHIGIRTVADLLRAEPEATAERLRNRHIKPDTIRQWQQQAIFVCRVPQLRGHDAQILIACGISDPEQLGSIDPAALWRRVQPLVKTVEGKRILRNGKSPDLDEIRSWIQRAAQARPLRAA
jgi:uncharacterized protein YhaN